MRGVFATSFFLVFISFFGSARANNPLSDESIESSLIQGELIGRIHGAVKESGLFIVTIRSKDNFFKYRNFPLAPENTEVGQQLADLNRHDQVELKGVFVRNRAKNVHFRINRVRLLKKWDTKADYKRDIPEITGQGVLAGRVHAVEAKEGVLVLEKKDGIFPIFIHGQQAEKKLKQLFRNDEVEVSYNKSPHPGKPIHLTLAKEKNDALKLTKSIKDIHGKKLEMTGVLVRFEKSPQLNRPIFALREERPNFYRYYTLVNFEDMAIFEALYDKLGNLWDEKILEKKAGRNMEFNPAITLSVTGIGNLVSKSQANPQLLIKRVDDVKLEQSR